jgi:isopentenyl-diphosphate Delta-isomerase
MLTKVILVDEADNAIGLMEKLEAHRKGVLHRAFSIFIFNSKGQMLLQQRALGKYHSAGLWTNTCCSHPAPGEETTAAAVRRLKEELGINTPIKKIFDFTYRAEFENGLTEHEFDHVFTGEYEGSIIPDPDEVKDFAYLSITELKELLKKDPERFTAWFRLAFPKIENWWNKHYAAGLTQI